MLSLFVVRSLIISAALLCCLTVVPAHAQLRGKFTVGVSVTKFEPAASELKTKVRVVPTLGRVPNQGWNVALGLNWFEADVDGSFVNFADRFGKVTVRPFMAGVGYTLMRGRFSVNPSIIAGPSWNTLEVDGAVRDIFTVGGDDFGSKAETVSLAVRPGISATYAVTDRFGLTAFTGYLFNRPDFKVRTPFEEIQTEWKADGLSVSAGIVIALF